MASFYGTGKSFKEWCKILHDTLIAQGATVLNDFNFSAEINKERNFDKYCIYQLQGSGQEKPIIAIGYVYDTVLRHAMITCHSMRSYVRHIKAETIKSQYKHVCYYHLDVQVSYNLIVNQRRIFFRTTQNQTNQELYAGFFLPLAKPQYYQYPCIVMGSNYLKHTDRELVSFVENKNFMNVELTRAEVCLPTNSWLTLTNEHCNNGFKIFNHVVVGGYFQSGASKNDFSEYFYEIQTQDVYIFDNFYIYSDPQTEPSNLGGLDGVYLMWGVGENNAISRIDSDLKLKCFNQGQDSSKFYGIAWEL